MLLSERLKEALEIGGDSTCCEIGGDSYSYGYLGVTARRVSAALSVLDPAGAPVAIVADHSLLGYATVVAGLVSGRPYVPIKPGLPLERVEFILRAAGCRVLVGDSELLSAIEPRCQSLGVAVVSSVEGYAESELIASRDPSSIAYIMFTSGSTGQPKGVILTSANVLSYVVAALELFDVQSDDRCTQLFDLSFDLSVHDVLVTLLSGARLCVDVPRQLVDPVGFAAACRATVWFSVPSVLSMAKRFRRLKPGVLPELRLALFCGEALPKALALQWLDAAPNARSYNVYGPTEATIAITQYEFDRERLSDLEDPLVPIGRSYPNSECIVVNKAGRLAHMEEGELWLGGPQLSLGYLNAPELTSDRFVEAKFSGRRGSRWYRSGDLVIESQGGDLLFRGRLDNQVKVNGNRIELAEIESVTCGVEGVDEAAAFTFESAPGLTAIGCGITGKASSGEIVEVCRAKLPDYMVPNLVLALEAIPLNINGKIDRNALAAIASLR